MLIVILDFHSPVPRITKSTGDLCQQRPPIWTCIRHVRRRNRFGSHLRGYWRYVSHNNNLHWQSWRSTLAQVLGVTCLFTRFLFKTPFIRVHSAHWNKIDNLIWQEPPTWSWDGSETAKWSSRGWNTACITTTSTTYSCEACRGMIIVPLTHANLSLMWRHQCRQSCGTSHLIYEVSQHPLN